MYILDTDHLTLLQRARGTGQAAIVAGDARLEQILSCIANARVLPYSTVAARVFEHIRRKRVRVATMDLRVVAIAISQQMTVVTRKTIDFKRVPGLQIEDWTKRK